MALIAVRFANDSDDVTLRWEVRQHHIAVKWLGLLRDAIRSGLNENDRIYNLPNQRWNKDVICQELESCMRSIEVFHPNFFKSWPHPNMSNEECNVLHTYFEELRGSIESPSTLYIKSPPSIRDEISRYNILIHRWESYVNRGPARLVCTFNIVNRVMLSDDDYRLFDLKTDPWAMCLNYPLVGKQMLDVFRDQDEVVSPDAIRPMDQFSANFLVRFSPIDQETADKILRSFNSWFTERSEVFQQIGLVQHSNKLALGFIQVADPIGPISNDILARIGAIGVISSVEIEEDVVDTDQRS